jgi:hypothetical protein
VRIEIDGGPRRFLHNPARHHAKACTQVDAGTAFVSSLHDSNRANSFNPAGCSQRSPVGSNFANWCSRFANRYLGQPIGRCSTAAPPIR